ncbi:glycosyltransferase family 2 protein [Brevibacillus migulae]|uniref:glycosyltransferase family 2 protein n=1 Tax=Brevibacillus migulae TaxID=1644114 RepID=UPI00106E0630|nr:glycosyltransferase [Brevibacillus migulae]
MTKLSLAMIVKNEEKHLERCLQSVRNIVDEMIIVDTGSQDRTIEIAHSFGAKVVHYKWNHNFSEARNVSINHASGEWILILDADEFVLGGQKEKIESFISGKKAVGRVSLISKFEHNGEVRYSTSFLSRLFPRGVFYEGFIHEQVVTDLPHLKTGIEIFHEGYYKTEKSNRNLPILLRQLEVNQSDPYILFHIAKNYKNMGLAEKALEYFVSAYNYRNRNEGYTPLLIVEYLQTLLEARRFSEGLEIINNESDYLSAYPDFHFAVGMFYLDYVSQDVMNRLHFLDDVERSFLTCLEIGDVSNFDSVNGTGSYLALYNLGVLYEVTGDIEKAILCYEDASRFNYAPAEERLALLEI